MFEWSVFPHVEHQLGQEILELEEERGGGAGGLDALHGRLRWLGGALAFSLFLRQRPRLPRHGVEEVQRGELVGSGGLFGDLEQERSELGVRLPGVSSVEGRDTYGHVGHREVHHALHEPGRQLALGEHGLDLVLELLHGVSNSGVRRTSGTDLEGHGGA